MLLLLFSASSQGMIVIPVPNGDFEEITNNDSEEAPLAGLLGSYEREFGTGPWSASGTGVLNLLAAPETTIGGGVATVSGLAYLSLGSLSNQASFYQNDIGSTFVEGYTYTLSASIITTETLGLTALNNTGTGITLMANGTETPAPDGSNVLLDLNILDTNTGTLTYTFTADATIAGQDIGVRLYTGLGSGLADVDALGTISFNNVNLSAVPEPAHYAIFLSMLTAGFVLVRRSGRGA